MLRIAVCDDDQNYLKTTSLLLQQWGAEKFPLLHIDTFTDGDLLLERNQSSHFDIIFLDIMMPLFNGMETAKELRRCDNSVKIVFLTSSPEFALESYTVKATDYLLKPITYDRLKGVMDDCCSSLSAEPENIVLRTVTGYQKIYLHEIECIEAMNKKTLFHLRGEKIVEGVEPLYLFEEKLAANACFYKCHRSFLVYLPSIDHFNQSEAVTRTGLRIPIARSYTKTFRQAYFHLIFEE